MNRSQTRARQILISSEDGQRDENPVAEMELRNWAAWIKGIKDPIPGKTTKALSIFQQLLPDYPYESASSIAPDIPRAEICESIISRWCTNRDIYCFIIVFVREINYEFAAQEMKRLGYSRTNKNNFGEYLKIGMTRVETAFGIMRESD